MNKLILDSILKRINKKESKLLIFTLSYYAILALIPTLFFSLFILDLFSLNTTQNFPNIFQYIYKNNFTNLTVICIIIYMLFRIFFIISEKRFSILKSSILSLIFSIIFIASLSLFFTTYIFKNNLISILIKIILIFLFLFALIQIFSYSKIKYSFIFSASFSIVANLFIYIFTLATKFFINYESYYGILAPIFIVVLAIHLLIYIFFIAYIGAEEFTKISKIKFIKG